MVAARTFFLIVFVVAAVGANAASVSLSWNASAGNDVEGYFIYIGNESRHYNWRINVGNQTQFAVIGLPGSTTYYFAATAYNATRTESEYSNEVSVTIGPVAGDAGLEVVEFYKPDADHYFLTANPAEQSFVDTGAVGRWLRTGRKFKAGGSVPVCRFYGNTAIDPVTGRPYGPNSHFYTADPGECLFLNAIYSWRTTSWRFESFDFSTTRAIDGACPSGLIPVYRAYNNGFARGIESNHRFSADRSAMDEVIAQGWLDEGIAFCAPP